MLEKIIEDPLYDNLGKYEKIELEVLDSRLSSYSQLSLEGRANMQRKSDYESFQQFREEVPGYVESLLKHGFKLSTISSMFDFSISSSQDLGETLETFGKQVTILEDLYPDGSIDGEHMDFILDILYSRAAEVAGRKNMLKDPEQSSDDVPLEEQLEELSANAKGYLERNLEYISDKVSEGDLDMKRLYWFFQKKSELERDLEDKSTEEVSAFEHGFDMDEVFNYFDLCYSSLRDMELNGHLIAERVLNLGKHVAVNYSLDAASEAVRSASTSADNLYSRLSKTVQDDQDAGEIVNKYLSVLERTSGISIEEMERFMSEGPDSIADAADSGIGGDNLKKLVDLALEVSYGFRNKKGSSSPENALRFLYGLPDLSKGLVERLEHDQISDMCMLWFGILSVPGVINGYYEDVPEATKDDVVNIMQSSPYWIDRVDEILHENYELNLEKDESEERRELINSVLTCVGSAVDVQIYSHLLDQIKLFSQDEVMSFFNRVPEQIEYLFGLGLDTSEISELYQLAAKASVDWNPQEDVIKSLSGESDATLMDRLEDLDNIEAIIYQYGSIHFMKNIVEYSSRKMGEGLLEQQVGDIYKQALRKPSLDHRMCHLEENFNFIHDAAVKIENSPKDKVFRDELTDELMETDEEER